MNRVKVNKKVISFSKDVKASCSSHNLNHAARSAEPKIIYATQRLREGDIAGPNASSWAHFLILRHFAVHLGQEYFSRDIYVYSTRIHNNFLSPIYLLNSNTGVRIRSIFGMLVIWMAL